jgi:predicted P-loop ATPase
MQRQARDKAEPRKAAARSRTRQPSQPQPLYDWEPPSPPSTRPAKAKAAKKASGDKADTSEKKTKWREKSQGKPIASLENTFRAIRSLGVAASYDLFHERMIISQRGGKVADVDRGLLGDVSDDNLLMLRQKVSRAFGFDPTDRFVRDAIKIMARENCFDPVCDLLDEARRKWDKKKRLDRLAPDYFNVADTELNRAFGRKVLIAMARRARHPGAKFDTIWVLESPEGFSKSTGFAVLAGDENFSDEPVIGRESREVQEQIAGKWLHESADLAGMKKAEVETVKTFASRTTDRARPAYGHMIKEQPRRCVMVGTTNSTEYLQSQTGNRRFWPSTVLAPIDIEKLKRDRLQLLGEAAFYEAQGESLFLDPALWAVAAVEQEARRVRDAWEDVLAKELYMHTDVRNGEEAISSAVIMQQILSIDPGHLTPAHSMRLSNVMRAIGWLRHPNNNVFYDGEQVKGYYRPSEAEPSQRQLQRDRVHKNTKPLPPTNAQLKAAKKNGAAEPPKTT